MLQVLLLATILTHADPGSGTLHGVVRARGSLESLPHAVVRIVELNRAAATDEKGYFVIGALPSGRWRAEASAIGYDTHGVTIVVSGGTVRLDFELPLRPVPMPVLEVRSVPTGETETASAPLLNAGASAVRVHSRALRTVPGLVEPDVLRSLQTLPSVAAMSDFSSALYVRGGAADQTAVILDGMPLFNPYHVGGLFSAIPVAAVAAVDVWAGGMPARAADRLAGSVQIHSRDGARDRVRASGGVGLLSSQATVDGPLGAGSFLVSGRRTYIDAISDAAYAVRLTDVTVPYGFSDVYGKVTMPTGELGAVSVSGYHNAESLAMPRRMRERTNNGSGPDFRWGSSMAALNWRQPLTPALLLEARAGISAFRGSFEAWEIADSWIHRCTVDSCELVHTPSDSVHVLSATTRNSNLSAGTELTWYGSRHTLRAGLQLDGYRHLHDVRQFDDVDTTRVVPFLIEGSPATVALHAEDEWRIGDRFSARLGARALFAGDLGSSLMPRASIQARLTRRLSVSAGGGTYAQPLRSLRNDESIVSSLTAYDLIASQPVAAGLQKGWDAVAGVALTDVATALRAELYTRRMSSLVLQSADAEPMNAPFFLAEGYTIGSGAAHGLELSAQHRFRGAELGVAYTLAVAEREVDGRRYTARFERRHMLDLNAVWHWGERSLLSARGVVGSGQPYTPVVGMQEALHYDPISGQWTWQGSRLVLGEYNSARLPAYVRVDVAARREYARRWFGRDVTVTPYLQVLNVLNHRNTLIGEPQGGDRPRLERLPQFPFLPTFGFEWRH